VGHVACKEEMRNVYKILIRKPKGKRPLGRLRHRWEDNIKMYFRKTVERCELDASAQDRDQQQALVNTVTYLQVP